jgi:vitamin B12 transporter
MNKLLATASAFALSGVPMAFAQSPFDLGEITVTATKSGAATALDRTGATVEVVTEQDLQNAGEPSVADYLSRLPGVSSSTNGGLGSTAFLRVRGLDGKYIKVLIDGIDVTDPSSTQTQFNWGGLTAAGIGRVELLKGSSSSLYGSRAIGGVVNVLSPVPEEDGTTVSVAAEPGSFSTYRYGAGIAQKAGGTALSFSINRLTTDGFSAASGPANTENDGYEATRLNLTGAFEVTDVLTLGFAGLYQDAEGDFDEFGGDGTPPFDEVSSDKSKGLRAYAELTTGAVQHTFSTTYYNNDRTSSSNGFDTSFEGERRRVDYTGVYTQSDALNLTFGGDWERESFNSGADAGETDTTGIFGEVLYAATADIDLAASLRYDDHSTFGGNLSGRLAAAWRVTDATTLRAVAATGFRAPSLYELNSTLYGNAALQPETSTSFELGIEHQFGGGSFVKATGFYTQIDDLIQFVTLTSFPQPFTGQYQQVSGTSTTKGIELSGVWALRDGLDLFGAYTFTDAIDATGAPVLRVPGHDLIVGLGADLTTRLGGELTVQHVADRPDDFGTVMPDYTVVNAALSYDITDTTEAYLRIENLLNEDYETTAGFNASDRAVYVGLRASF